MWTVTQDLPRHPCALDEHQTAIYRYGILYCLAFLKGESSGKGVLAFLVELGWDMAASSVMHVHFQVRFQAFFISRLTKLVFVPLNTCLKSAT
jgi:hypothetical protein